MQLDAGQVAVVTGGASGIGLGLVEGFLARGLRVVVADVRQDAVGEVVDRLQHDGSDVIGVPTDVRDPDAVEALAAATLARFGRVDVVCNNAGVVGPFAPTWEQDLATYRWIIDVALMGVVNGIHAFVPHLVRQGSGHVVNTASVGGLIVLPGLSPYNAAKHAVVGLSETLLAELRQAGTGVGVSILCPGMVSTPLALTSDLNRPEGVPAAAVPPPRMEEAGTGHGSIWTAADIAVAVLSAIETDRLHVITHPETVQPIRARIDSVLADLPAG